MKKVIFSIFFIGIFLCISVCGAGMNGMTYGINAVLAPPMGDFGDMAKIGMGISGQVEYPLTPMIMATGSIGYLMWDGKDAFEEMDYSWDCIPIKVGIKYPIKESGFYAIAELGMYMFSYEFEMTVLGETMKHDDSESEMGIAPGIGYCMPLTETMMLDISAQYEMAGDFDFLGIDIGIRF